MIHHFPARSATLDLHPPDEGHQGEMTNLWRHCYKNEERLFEIGFSDFSGDMRMLASSGYLGVVVITGGTGTLHTDDDAVAFETGDVLVYEAPVGPQRIVSDGCTYVYANIWDSPDARAAVTAGLAPAVPDQSHPAPAGRGSGE